MWEAKLRLTSKSRVLNHFRFSAQNHFFSLTMYVTNNLCFIWFVSNLCNWEILKLLWLLKYLDSILEDYISHWMTPGTAPFCWRQSHHKRRTILKKSGHNVDVGIACFCHFVVDGRYLWIHDPSWYITHNMGWQHKLHWPAANIYIQTTEHVGAWKYQLLWKWGMFF